ncbi:unnamed protein product [Dracunculus medinensis]|uniref:SH3 domain-containing protein n=1 Tax=Dracunculus medinensis TaxID=318479 RepID=A0A0N4U9T9_DRAME|nr:unnamed protein product [Dracunculus medinensis]
MFEYKILNVKLNVKYIETVDPVYLALKQATGKYGRRSSNYDSTTPSPRNLSEGSLQDSGYAEANYGPNLLDNSSSPVDQPGIDTTLISIDLSASAHNRRRPPKLHKQMKSISLDCAELPQPIPNNMNSGRTSNRSGMKPATPMKLNNSSGDIPNFDNNQCPSISSPRAPRRIHSSNGERIKIVDNGDPDWLYGFKLGERSDRLISFPSTCVALIQPSEQPMILKQSVHIPEAKIRLYRDQIVFAQPDSLVNGRLLVRTERNAFVECQLQYLSLL